MASLQAHLPSYSSSPIFVNCRWPLSKPSCLPTGPLRPFSTAPGLSSSPPAFLQRLAGLPQLPLASLQALMPSYIFSPAFLNFPWPLSRSSCLPTAPIRPSSTSPGLSPSPPAFLQPLSGLPQLPLASLQVLLTSYSSSPAFLNCPWPLSKPSCLPTTAPLKGILHLKNICISSQKA